MQLILSVVNMLPQMLEAISRERHGPKTIKLLYMLSYFSSQNIPTDIFRVMMNETELETSIELLKQFLLIDASNKSFISVNKLMQRKIRLHIREEQKEKMILKEIVEVILHTAKNCNKFDLVVDHAISMWLHIQNFNDVIQVASAVPRFIVVSLIHQSKHELAASFTWEALELLKTLLANTHIDVLRLEFQFANLLENTGKYKEAVRILMPLYLRDVIDPEFNKEIIHSIISVVKKMQEMFQYNEVLLIYEKLLGNQNVADASSEEILIIWYYYAHLLMELEKYEHSIEILKGIKHKRKVSLKTESVFLLNLLGENCTDILKTKKSVLSELRKAAKYNEAIKMCEELISEYKSILGENHIGLSSIQTELALTYYSQSEYAKAAKIFKDVYEKKNEIPFEDNDDKQSLVKCFAAVSLKKKFTMNNSKIDSGALYNAKLNDAIMNENEFDCEQIYLLVDSDLAKIYALIQSGFDINSHDSRGNTLLHYAAKSDDLSLIRLLIKFGSIYNAKNKEGITPSQLVKNNDSKNLFDLVYKLFKSVKSENNTEVMSYIEQERCIVNAKDVEGHHPLHWAVAKGNITILKILLEAGANATYISHKGNTPLHIAASKELPEIVEVLLRSVKYDELDSFINAKTHGNGVTALHVATKSDDWEIVPIFLLFGAIFNIKNNEGVKPVKLYSEKNFRRPYNLLKMVHELFQDAKSGRISIIHKLGTLLHTDMPAIVNARNDQGFNFIEVLIINNHKKLAYDCLQILKYPYKLQPWEPVESKLNQIKDLLEIVEFLFYALDKDISKLQAISGCYREDTNPFPIETTEEGSYCVRNGYSLVKCYQRFYPIVVYDVNILQICDILKELQFEQYFKFGVYKEQEGRKYSSLLNSSSNRDIRHFINFVDIDIYIPGMKFSHLITEQLQSLYSNALFKAIKNENLLDIEKYLKENETIVDLEVNGITPLYYCIELANEKVLKLLLENGADVTRKVSKGCTVLHLATTKQNKSVIELLLQYTPSQKLSNFINHKNFDGDTSLHIAAKNGYALIITTLLKYGAIYNIKSNNGKTPLDLTKKLHDNLSHVLQIIHQCFQHAENNSPKLSKILHAANYEEIIAISNAKNEEGCTLLKVMERKCYKPEELLHKNIRTEMPQSAVYIKYRNKKIENAARTFFNYAALYNERLLFMARIYPDDLQKANFSWHALKEVTLCFINVFRFVKTCIVYPECQSNEHLLKVIKALEESEFDPQHVWLYTDKAKDQKAESFGFLGRESSYCKLLSSDPKRGIEKFLKFDHIEIHNSVKNLLRDIYQNKI